MSMVQTSDNPSSGEPQRTPEEAAFRTLLEQFMFKAENLSLVKTAIAKLVRGEINETQLKEQILYARLSMMKEVIRLFIIHKGRYEEKIEGLTQQVGDYKELLKNIIPRLELLEQTISPTSSNIILPTNINDAKLEPERLEQKLKQAMAQINIELWIEVFPLNLNEEKVRDDYRFITQLFTILEIYHDDLFNIEESKRRNLENPPRIENLNFPLVLHDNLVKLLSIRNSIAHRLYTLKPNDVELAYVTYFQLIFHLFKEAFGNKLVEQNRVQIKAYFTQLIQDQMDIDSYITAIAYNELNKEF
jgi:hypothetical protein